MTLDLVTATHQTFAPFVGQVFAVAAPGGAVEMTLDNVKLLGERTQRDNHLEIEGVVYPPRRAFALTFVGPKEPVLPATTYPISHPETGTMHLYLSGFRQDRDGMLYESAFS